MTILPIFIPTFQRTARQETWDSLPPELQANTLLVCPIEEFKEHVRKGRRVIIQPAEITTISAKRHWIVETAKANGYDKLIMLDDDCCFYARRPGSPKLRKEDADNQFIIDTFAEISEKLEDYAHVGISARAGNNRVESDWKEIHRMCFALGYRTETYLKHVVPGRVKFREDFDVSLQLLREGYANIVCFKMCVAPAPFGAPGGCSAERTIEESSAQAHVLASLHPGLVKVVQKDYGTVAKREEVIVYWQRAFQQGLAKRNGGKDSSDGDTSGTPGLWEDGDC